MLGKVAEVGAGQNEDRLRLHVVDRGGLTLDPEPAEVATPPVAACHHPLRADLVERHALHGKQRVARSAVEGIALAVERVREQRCDARRKRADREMQAAIQHAALQVLRRLYRQLDTHVVVALVETLHRPAEWGVRIGNGAVYRADAQRAGQSAAGGAGGRRERLHREEQALRLAIDQRALVGQREPCAAAAAQPHPEALLKRRDIAADRRCAQIELGLRCRESLAIGDGGEDPQ